MSATITWVIQWMKASTQTINGFQEVVVECGWACNGEQANTATPPQTFSNSIYSTATFTAPPVGDPNYIPYSQLTEQDVLGWVWASGVDQAATEAAVQSNLDALINPEFVQPSLPWVA